MEMFVTFTVAENLGFGGWFFFKLFFVSFVVLTTSFSAK